MATNTIQKFLDEQTAKGTKKSTLRMYAAALKRLNTFKPVDKITKDDLVQYFNAFKCADSTRMGHTIVIKFFYKSIGKPDVASWLKPKRPKESLRSDDLLTAEDVQKMIDATDSFYWKSLLAILYETGARISEVQALKWKDLIMTEFTKYDDGTETKINAFRVHIKTEKTSAGFRKMILPYSTSYLLNLMELAKHDPDEVVFNLKYRHSFEVIAEIGRRAKITKHVHPHGFRHARATADILEGMSEPLVRKKLGWSKNSTVPSRYIHISDTDVEDYQSGRKLNHVNGNIKIAEKVDVRTAFDEVQAMKDENAQLRKDMEQMKSWITRLFTDGNEPYVSEGLPAAIPEDVKKRATRTHQD